MALLAARIELARRAARVKAKMKRASRDASREKEVLRERREWAQDAGLDVASVARVFEAILDLSRRSQKKK